jgi:hypothetical protein
VSEGLAVSSAKQYSFFVQGKGKKIRVLPLDRDSVRLLDHYLCLERPAHGSSAPRRRRARPIITPAPPISIIAHDEGSGVDAVRNTPEAEVNDTFDGSDRPINPVLLKSAEHPSSQSTTNDSVSGTTTVAPTSAYTP